MAVSGRINDSYYDSLEMTNYNRISVMKPETTETLLEFPCEFPVKAMGKTTDDFDALVVSIIRKHVPEFEDGTVKTRLSRGGKYISVTVTIQAQNQEQLDNLYMELSANESVLVAL